ncbi:flagellar biosynthesis protein FlhF [Cytobacillus sp. FJAT-54145]|uniref:Flagellar biosynthesis protein FlhF n=1 Tax=Cytobacillus spartinae TaxID=3299023 RepID=A0ABW6K846_9BACI
MKIKKYVANSMPEAMKQIRAELGNDAVILNSKMVHTGGFLGFFKKKGIEVIAAVDPTPKAEPKLKEKAKKEPEKPSLKIEHGKEVINKSPEINTVIKPSEELLKELSELKGMIKNLSSPTSERISYPEPVQEAAKILTSQEVDNEIKEEILTILLEKWYLNGGQGANEVVKGWMKDLLSEKLAKVPFGEITFTKKYVNVVGPTGVGKTTTLAKMAAECSLKYKKKVALITTDTYRIAAIEQLKTYAKILSMPLEVCYNLDDFKKACDSFRDFDVVLIDTAGRNFRNKQYVEDLKGIIDYNNEMETFLVLALTAKQRDMEDIYEQFSTIDIDRFIFTKSDETSNYGAMLNLTHKYNKGIAYITTGQNVPDDMILANPNVVTKFIVGVE